MDQGWKDETNYEQNTQLVVPGEMYGVLTGRPNNILVVDWDCYSDKCEFPITEDFLAWKAKAVEKVPTLSERVRAGTTYFAWDEERFGDWKGTVGIEGFIDIRTTDNYVVGPDSPGYELLRGDIKNLPQMPNDLFSLLDGKVGHKVERADTECSYTQASVTLCWRTWDSPAYAGSVERHRMILSVTNVAHSEAPLCSSVRVAGDFTKAMEEAVGITFTSPRSVSAC